MFQYSVSYLTLLRFLRPKLNMVYLTKQFARLATGGGAMKHCRLALLRLVRGCC